MALIELGELVVAKTLALAFFSLQIALLIESEFCESVSCNFSSTSLGILLTMCISYSSLPLSDCLLSSHDIVSVLQMDECNCNKEGKMKSCCGDSWRTS